MEFIELILAAPLEIGVTVAAFYVARDVGEAHEGAGNLVRIAARLVLARIVLLVVCAVAVLAGVMAMGDPLGVSSPFGLEWVLVGMVVVGVAGLQLSGLLRAIFWTLMLVAGGKLAWQVRPRWERDLDEPDLY